MTWYLAKHKDNFTFNLYESLYHNKEKDGVPVLNQIPLHEDVLGEWRYSRANS
jgi:hypothetical protein